MVIRRLCLRWWHLRICHWSRWLWRIRLWPLLLGKFGAFVLCYAKFESKAGLIKLGACSRASVFLLGIAPPMSKETAFNAIGESFFNK